MNCLIVGANFYNKGAQLMLLTLIEQLKENLKDVKICVSPMIGTKEELQKLEVELLDFPLMHVGGGKKFIYFLKYGNLIKLLKEKYRGNIKLNDVDVVFDLSGFAFGEQWGTKPTENLNLLIDRCIDLEIKYILMPQAFGPFKDPDLKEAIRKVLNSANLIFARDKISYQHLTSISGSAAENVFLAPDVTLFSKQGKNQTSNKCCIVPNTQVLDKGSPLWENSYLTYLQRIIEKIINKSNKEVLILIHDKIGGDAKIGSELKSLFKDNNMVKLYYEENPLKIKNLISESEFLVGSRFHALASALSSNVPSIGIGWSHKYEMLFQDYDCQSYVFIEPDDNILLRLEELLNEPTNLAIRHKLRAINESLKHKNDFMWEKIKNVLAS